MRVLLLNDTTAFAGTERHLVDLALGLATEGVEVSIACPQHSALAERAGAAGIVLHRLEFRGVRRIIAPSRLSALVARHEFDVVHAHNGKTGLLGALALSCRQNFHLVFTQHFLEPAHTKKTGWRSKVWRIAHDWVERRFSHFIAISEAVRDRMLARGEGCDSTISVVHNGIERPNLIELKEPGEIKRQLEIDLEDPLIVCVARLEPEKDCATLVKAMAKVRASLPNARCAIVGNGGEFEALRRVIAELNLAETVKLAGFQADAHAWIRAADLFVLPSIAEPFGLVLLEAMALGKPVVATNVGGPCEIVVPSLTGLLVPPQDPEILAAAILQLLSDPKRRAIMGENGRQRFLEKFTAASMAKKTIEVHRRAIKQASHR